MCDIVNVRLIDWLLVSTPPDCTRLCVAHSGSSQHCWSVSVVVHSSCSSNTVL